MQVRVTEDNEAFGKCGCGRSPTGKCIGWHGLTEEAFRVELAQWESDYLKTVDTAKTYVKPE